MLFSLPQGTEMFQFPWCASAAAMDSLQGDRALPRPGFPIRTSPDRCLLTAPRGHIAVRRVLHRLLVPRHPPCALSSLTYRPCLKARTCISLKDVHSLSGFQCASLSAPPETNAPAGRSSYHICRPLRNPQVLTDEIDAWWSQGGSNS